MSPITQFQFDANQFEPLDAGFEAIPAGWYKVSITKAEIKQNQKKNGYYLEAWHTVIEGPNKGAQLIARLNIINESEQGQRMGLGQLSALSHAIKRPVWNDTTQLCGIPLKVRVKIEAGNDQYEPSNVIVAWRDVNFTPQGELPSSENPVGFPPAANGPSTSPSMPALSLPPSSPVQPQSTVPAVPGTPPTVSQPTQAPAQPQSSVAMPNVVNPTQPPSWATGNPVQPEAEAKGPAQPQPQHSEPAPSTDEVPYWLKGHTE